MKRAILAVFILSLACCTLPFTADAQEKIEINFFYSATCPHCAEEEEFLADLVGRYPQIDLRSYEVISSEANRQILYEFYERYDVPRGARGPVPVTFTPSKYFVGFDEGVGRQIETCLQECIEGENINSDKIRIPVLGEVDVSKVSLLAVTFVLGILDGFNPCAMWVLVILVSILLSLKSRKKIAWIGGTFIFAEGLLYFLFMSAWLNMFLAMKFVAITRLLIGIFAIVFGVMRIRDFIKWKPGVCKVTEGTDSKNKIVQRMQRVLNSKTLFGAVVGVFALAFGVNVIEFFCSAGFPVLFTRILTLQDIGQLQYYLYLFLYNILYMLDDFIVLGAALFAFNRFGFSDKYNRYSTLFAGALIIILGSLLILKPELLMFAGN